MPDYGDYPDFDLEAYLVSKGLDCRRTGTEIYTHCIFCTQGQSSGKPGKLYFNDADASTRGLYECKVCGSRGNYRTLRKHYGDPIEDGNAPSEINQYVYTAAAKAYAEVLHSAPGKTALEWLGAARGLTNETIDSHMLGLAPGGRWLYDALRSKGFSEEDIFATNLCWEREGKPLDFFQNEVTIPYLVGPACLSIRGKDMGGKYRGVRGEGARLFNTNATWGAEEIVVCEGEFDAMVLEQLGFRAVAVPGATNWKPAWNGYFDEAKRVWAMYDPDPAGNAGADKLMAMLGPKVKKVNLPVPEGVSPSEVDPSYMLVHGGWTKEKVALLLKEAVRQNSKLVTPLHCFESLNAVDSVGGFKLGFPTLDHAIRPGITPGRVMILLARTNVGKTLYLANVLQRASMVKGQEDFLGLYLSLEGAGYEWADQARKIWSFYNPECPPDERERRAQEYWQSRLRVVEPGSLTLDDLHQMIEDMVDEFGRKPDVICLDYIGFWVRGFSGGDLYTRTTEAVHALKVFASSTGIPIIAPHQLSRAAELGKEPAIDQGRDSGAIEETGDYVVTMWSLDTIAGAGEEQMSGDLNMRIGKSRRGGKGKSFKYVRGLLTCAIVPVEEHENVTRVRREAGWASDSRVTWEDAMEHHITGTMRNLSSPTADYLPDHEGSVFDIYGRSSR